MNWFTWVLVALFSSNIILHLAYLAGYKPKPSSHLAIGITLLIEAFLLAGIFVWL